MTPEAQRIAIAEACGWEWKANGFSYHPYPGWYKGHEQCHVVALLSSELPDYLNDLNAMHEVERTGLKDINELNRYADELDKVCVPTHICSLTHWQSVVMATAAQRAEAFLRTIGKWKDETL